LTVTSNDRGAGLSMTYVFMYDLLTTLCRVFFEKSMVSQRVNERQQYFSRNSAIVFYSEQVKSSSHIRIVFLQGPFRITPPYTVRSAVRPHALRFPNENCVRICHFTMPATGFELVRRDFHSIRVECVMAEMEYKCPLKQKA
jgi:hypothetical protein